MKQASWEDPLQIVTPFGQCPIEHDAWYDTRYFVKSYSITEITERVDINLILKDHHSVRCVFLTLVDSL